MLHSFSAAISDEEDVELE